MRSLPHIDTHSLEFTATDSSVWAAVIKVFKKQMSGSEKFAKSLGCEPSISTPEFTGETGETVPGFRITRSEPPHKLVLSGLHRFSDYRLTFLIKDHRLYAETHAVFPGMLGALYKTAVISSGAHSLVTKTLLKKIVRKANTKNKLG